MRRSTISRLRPSLLLLSLSLCSLLLLCGLVSVCAQQAGDAPPLQSNSTAGDAQPLSEDEQVEEEKEDDNAHPFLEVYGLLNGSWFKFFVIVVAASRIALVAPRFGLPLITGYMIVGCACGPYILGLVSKTQIPDLSYVTQIALSFIAFSAGSELYLPELRSLFRTIALITGFNALFSYFVCTLFIYLLAATGVIPWMKPYIGGCAFSISLVAGSIMVARSPASAIAVVRELKAKGPATSIMLGVTVVGDVVVLILFTLSNSFALALCTGGGFNGGEFVVTILTLFAAVGMGYGLGFVLIFLLWIPRVPARYTIIPLGFLIFVICDWLVLWSEAHWGIALNFDALLICITAGYVVTNKSHNRIPFLKMLGGCGPYIFMPFFTLVGVQLNLPILAQSIAFGVLVFLCRAGCIAAGTYVGGTLAGLDHEKRTRLWMTMLAQAGVSLGLAAEVAVKFPEWGSKFQTTIISVVLINQFAGPVMCKYALRKFGEAGKMTDEGEEHDEHGGARPKKLKRALLFGIDSTALAVAARLLKAGWRVSCIDVRRENLILASALGIPKEHTNSCLDGGDHTLFPSPWTVVPTLPLDPMPEAGGNAETGRAGLGLGTSSSYREHRGPVVFHDGSGSFGSSSYDPHAPGSDATAFGPGPWEPLLDMVLAPPQNVTHTATGSAPSGLASAAAAAGAGAAAAASAVGAAAMPAPSPSASAAASVTGGTAGINTTGGATHAFSAKSEEEALAAQIMGHYIESVGDMDCGGVEACILSLPSDQSNYELGVWLMRARRAPRVLVRVINPSWTDTFLEQGLLPVSELSSTSAVLSAGAQSRGNLLVVSSVLPLHDALHSLIEPVEDLDHTLLPLSGPERAQWESAHPAPSAASFDSLVRHLGETGVEFGVNDRDDIHALSLEDLRMGRIDFLERMHSVHDVRVLTEADEARNEEIGMGISAHGLNDARKAEQRRHEEEERKAEEEAELIISRSGSSGFGRAARSSSNASSFSPRKQ